MNDSECLEKLNKWSETYVNGWKETTDYITFKVEDIDCKTTMGYYYSSKFSFEDGVKRVHCVTLDTKLMTFPDYLIKSVIWHEFCHLWVRFECGVVVDSHGKEFKNRQKTVLRYWFGDKILHFVWGLV